MERHIFIRTTYLSRMAANRAVYFQLANPWKRVERGLGTWVPLITLKKLEGGDRRSLGRPGKREKTVDFKFLIWGCEKRD